MSDTPSLLEKVAAIRDSLGIVRMQSSEGERSFEFAPAEDVLRKVRPQLKKHRLVAIPELGTSTRAAQRTTVELRITLRDLDAPEQKLVQTWAGEADGMAAAVTNALKTFYLATFQIRTEPADAAPRRKAKKDTGAAKLIGDDPERLESLRRTADQSGLDDDELAALLFERYGVRVLGHVPAKRSVELTDQINEAGAHKVAGRDPLSRAT